MAMLREVAARIGEPEEEFRRRWDALGNTRYQQPIRDVLRGYGVPDDAVEDVCAIRLAYNRRALVPRAGAVDTLRELRRRGHALGMISVCSEEVERLWPETELGGLFDAEVFSCSAGVSKPDPRIYLACSELLGVEPAAATFVGDGANDELAGARRVGMEAVLIHRPGLDPHWPELRDWDGPRIDAIPQILELV
ncbi:MAG TPA: HAD-IA family hydrolase [Gaiellaceae bacterium]|nr:HAD-IA family hydrolase [Gaiellaceae bacterium]